MPTHTLKLTEQQLTYLYRQVLQDQIDAETTNKSEKTQQFLAALLGALESAK
jgi:hypothetical protein